MLGLGVWVGLRSRSFTGQGVGGTGAAAWPPGHSVYPTAVSSLSISWGEGCPWVLQGSCERVRQLCAPSAFIRLQLALCGLRSYCGV